MKVFGVDRIKFCFALLAILWLLPSLGEAASRTIDCDAGDTIGSVLRRLRSGDTLLVSGTCNENITLTEFRRRITLDGQNVATINGTNPNSAAIQVRGRDITIKGFTITGGSNGILVRRGGTVVIDGNIIQNTGNRGINVGEHSFARIINNTIQNNPGGGIIVNETSAARIGFLSTNDVAASPNTIQNNGSDGILVSRSSSVRIAGNTISNNTGGGVFVNDGATADISDNDIDGNGGDGVIMRRNATVRLGRDTGTTIFEAPNRSDTTNNTGNGINCRLDGVVDGRIGTLNGTGGASDTVGCTNSLI